MQNCLRSIQSIFATSCFRNNLLGLSCILNAVFSGLVYLVNFSLFSYKKSRLTCITNRPIWHTKKTTTIPTKTFVPCWFPEFVGAEFCLGPPLGGINDVWFCSIFPSTSRLVFEWLDSLLDRTNIWQVFMSIQKVYREDICWACQIPILAFWASQAAGWNFP